MTISRRRADHPTTVRIPRELKAWLQKVAERQRWSFAQALTYAIEQGRARMEEAKK